jgi:hypothetical protein
LQELLEKGGYMLAVIIACSVVAGTNMVRCDRTMDTVENEKRLQ